jgi:hypothetical protein
MYIRPRYVVYAMILCIFIEKRLFMISVALVVVNKET